MTTTRMGRATKLVGTRSMAFANAGSTCIELCVVELRIQVNRLGEKKPRRNGEDRLARSYTAQLARLLSRGVPTN